MTTTGPRFRAPDPISLPQTRPGRRARRQAQTAAVFARHVGPVVVEQMVFRRDVHAAATARRLRRAFDELGSTYTKFGQLIASSPSAFGAETAEVFRSLLDQGAPVPFATVGSIIERELGAPVSELFASFEPTPIAAASMAVVHRAQLTNGRTVAVKVLRPEMAGAVALDVDIMQPLFRQLALAGVDMAGLLYRYLSGFRVQVAQELDLRNEARTMHHFRTLLDEAGLATIVIPEPIDDMTSRGVLVMEFLDGDPIDDIDAIQARGVDPAPVVRALLDFWFLTGLRDGVFHGDIHAGNLMLLRDGRLGLIDWGIVGVLDADTHAVFRKFVAAMLGDEQAWGAVMEFVAQMAPFTAGTDIARSRGAGISSLLTRPFGEVDLKDFVGDRAGGRRAGSSAGDDRNEERRRFRRAALRNGVADSEFGQANFLLLKQLLYFDRYGKLYLADQALLENREHLLDLLAEPSSATPTPEEAR